MPGDLELDRTERRIVGTMIEKSFTVPDAYPLTLNALVSGCCQKSARDPVMDLPDHHVEGALKSLFMKGWVEKNSRHGGRVARWGHRAVDRLGIDEPAQAILAELLLRGPQTPGEIRARASRMVPLGSKEDVVARLEALARPEHGLVELLPKQPGERARKWRHLLGGEAPAAPAAEEPVAAAISPVPPPRADEPEPRLTPRQELEQLREEVSALRAEVESLRARLESGGEA